MPPSPVSSPGEREAAIEAKIARIRANNEALIKRHREVEEDRRSAEKNDSALRARQNPGGNWDEEGAFRNPFHGDRPGRPRSAAGGRTSHRGRRDEPGRQPAPGGGGGGIKQRLGERDAPPPDPNYRYTPYP